MFPVLIFNGSLLLAFFFAGYNFWRKGREEHYDELVLFDGLLLSLFSGFILARAFYIILNFTKFHWSLLAWLDIFTYPGINYFVLFAGAGFYLYHYALKKKWDVFEILDFGVLSLAIAQVFIWLGMFWRGVNFGKATNLPWGMVFPGVFDKHHPLQLYFVVFYLLLFIYLSRVESKYRRFEWYRYGKKTAHTGFLTSMFFIWVGLFNALMSFWKISTLNFYGVSIDFLLSLAFLVFGLFLLGIRSGRISSKFLGKRNKLLLEKFKV